MAAVPSLSRSLEYALLGFLNERPMHGYDIYRELHRPDGIGIVWHITRSQLYALLVKLEEQGYISVSLQPQENRPTRRIFHLTETGNAAFTSWVVTPVERPRDIRLEFLVKLYFARREGTEAVFQLVRAQRVRCLEWLANYSARAEACRITCPFEWLVWQFRIGQVEAQLKWLERCILHSNEKKNASTE
ncbi:MAG: PadR family transcriptional regulator [Anaerolineae bacterium]|nr:PadR family transcriptional regulator [Anaerolineae bacterium]MDW8072258.1 PadR family transcriptional regulator [Anaerolineae bacterium]